MNEFALYVRANDSDKTGMDQVRDLYAPLKFRAVSVIFEVGNWYDLHDGVMVGALKSWCEDRVGSDQLGCYQDLTHLDVQQLVACAQTILDTEPDLSVTDQRMLGRFIDRVQEALATFDAMDYMFMYRGIF